ncbi:hypothetical protein BJF77_04475 [Kocuria sp. CNJ-770]|uniref:hypothetical protein n=1 Tax=Kocuria sp. CNJ-770 TaxID=1904964 RepID=UPI00095B9080|nr:hypothetical protein [Kocuria sp. CNJ-770]OLT04100.1 hypothetical protein BJF77_04475 [Kocuria sp. CNJ-770]
MLGGAPPALVLAGRALELTERHAEILLALSRAGAGLSTAELSARLWDGRAQEATVRAEVLRLRRLLDSRGGPVIASRPYRLCAPLPSDAGRVLELLDRGSHRRALREYTGALLPHSEAPAVVALRHRLSGLLREAVLTDGSAEAVRQYLELPEAADDAEAWALLLRLLPARSPPAGGARARAAARLTSGPAVRHAGTGGTAGRAGGVQRACNVRLRSVSHVTQRHGTGRTQPARRRPTHRPAQGASHHER